MKCSVNKRNVKRIVEFNEEIKSYVFTLTEREAVFIKSLVGVISGVGPVRGIADSIYDNITIDTEHISDYVGICSAGLNVKNFNEEKLMKFDNTV
jgi:hypothetical protein